MNFENEEDFVPKIDTVQTTVQPTAEPEKIELTEAEKEAWMSQYLEWVRTFYPIDEFEIEGNNGEPIKFFRFNPLPFHEKQKEHLIYFIKEQNNPTGKVIATIWVFFQDKKFNFLVDDWNRHRNGYGTAIYKNVQNILETLGVEDRENYSVTVAHQPEHPFLQHMRTKDLLADTNGTPDTDTAKTLLSNFEKHPYFVHLTDINSIVEYARKSGISDEEIVNSLNTNGFLIKAYTMDDAAIEKFKSFNLPGLKATSMHRTIMEQQTFAPLLLLSSIDKKDAALEFKRVIEDLENDATTKKKNGEFVPLHLREYGAVMHILLDWRTAPIMFQNLSTDIQNGVKQLVISTLDYFDEPHKSNGLSGTPITSQAIIKLAKSIPLDKDDYTSIYTKMLNRNYTLEEFRHFVSHYVSFSPTVEKEGNIEIAQNSYYPCPKYHWQDDSNLDRNHKMKRIYLPQKAHRDSASIRNTIKQAIIQNGIATKTKIKTDMTGVTKDGKPIKVENLKDWLFGVPGAHGNLKVSKSGTVIFLPPQTPKEAVRIIEGVVQEKFHSAPGSDGNR